VPGIGELLLAIAPLPVSVASGPLAGGTCALAPVVPPNPALSGKVAHLNALAVDPSLPSPLELTNALAVLLGP